MGYTEMYSQKLLDFEALLEGQRGTPLPSPSLVHPHGRGQATARAPCRGPGRDQGEHCVACVPPPLPSPSLVHPHGRGHATARAPCRGQGEHCVACVSMCAARLPCVAAVHGTLPCVCPVLRCPASQCAPRLTHVNHSSTQKKTYGSRAISTSPT